MDMMSGIGFDSTLLDYSTQNLSAEEKTKQLTSSIERVGQSDATDEELMDACKSFETYFLKQLFQEMKSTVHSSDDEGDYMKYFGDTLIDQYAEKATESGQIGLAKQLYESLKNSGVRTI